ncbi:cell envelope integrity protein TolA [Paraburkholderia sp.]|uniref:cell envelope integrity protein TolA n=1 Tax=Paraburkholderia sp. TaxID=1926495 RepID=UPI0023A2F7E4|nr:cell envelope integrity protein TolA [Paraburkholderia sp.]MDE1183407.1 cell envelope integrity protein TolA [Paraburkholderia sp.]
MSREQRSNRPVRPPSERGTWRAFVLALVMHALLGFFLYHGIQWQNSTPEGAEAELWTAVPDTPLPTPTPTPPAPVAPAPPPVPDEQADIALQEKKRQQQQQAAREAQLAEQQRQLKQQQEAEAKRQQQLAADQAAQLAAQKAAAAAKLKQQQQQQADKLKQQQLADQQKQQQLQKQQELKEQQEQADKQAQADAQKKADAQKAAKAKAAAQASADAKKLDQERRQRLSQMQGMAGGDSSSSNGLGKSGAGSGSGGNATSPGYADKVKRRVGPNIVWGGETTGLETVVAVRCAPTGTLLSATIRHSSGNDAWDAAALRAVQRSDPMPQDTDGKTPGSFTITLRPAG